jgi:hypothetical protein
VVEYACQGAQLVVLTYVRPDPSLEEPSIAKFRAATKQLVLIMLGNGKPPRREVIAYLVKALRRVTKADIDRMPERWLVPPTAGAAG